jgi:hypothetical protein
MCGIFAQDMDSRAQIILLGGSNLARGISTIVEIARQTVGGGADFLIAKGHGRSYGKRSTIVGRGLPGIIECGLWDALDMDEGRPTFALITDIGNDVAYGAPVVAIADWVKSCMERLAAARARTVVTPLPMESLRRLSPWRYKLARSIMFPGARFSLEEALGRCLELDELVRAVAATRDVRLVEQKGSWYGLDPIHIRMRHHAAAWTHIMSAWLDGDAPPRAIHRSVRRSLKLRTLTPQRWWLLGSPRGRAQPAAQLADGSTISLY